MVSFTRPYWKLLVVFLLLSAVTLFLMELLGFWLAVDVVLLAVVVLLILRAFILNPSAPFDQYLLSVLFYCALIFICLILPKMIFINQRFASVSLLRLHVLLQIVAGIPLASAVLVFFWRFLWGWTAEAFPRRMIIPFAVMALVVQGGFHLLYRVLLYDPTSAQAGFDAAWNLHVAMGLSLLGWALYKRSAPCSDRIRQRGFLLISASGLVLLLLVRLVAEKRIVILYLALISLPFIYLWSKGLTRRQRPGSGMTLQSSGGHWFPERGITPRESEIIDLVCRGLSNRQIEESLFISIKTVKRHMANIFQKLDVSSRLQLLAICYEKEKKNE